MSRTEAETAVPADRTQQLAPPTVVVTMVVAVIAVSASAILIRVADASPLAISFWRCLGGAVVLGPFALRMRRGAVALDRGQRSQLAGSGVLLALHFALWIGSLSYTTVASSVTLGTMSPVFVALGAAVFLDERADRRTWVGMTLTIVGALVIGAADWASVELGPRALFGDLLAFAGAVAVAGYLLAGRAARQRLPGTVYNAGVFAVAAVVLLAACLIGGVALAGYDTTTWLALAGLIVGPQLLGHALFNGLLSTVSATVVSIVVLAEPVVATLLAWWLLDELPSELFWLGAPIVLFGVGYAAARPRRRSS